MPRSSHRHSRSRTRSHSRSKSRSRSHDRDNRDRDRDRDSRDYRRNDRDGYRGNGNSGDRYDDRRRDREPSEDNQFRVHIADLTDSVTQADIEKTFGKYGEIEEVWLAKNPPCFAFVVFKNRDDADEAIKQMDGRALGGSRIRCTWARPRTRGRRRRFDPNMRCYQCGRKGHFSRDCENDSGRKRSYRRSRSGSRGRYNRDRSRDRSRSRRSYTRSRTGSRTPRKEYRSNGSNGNATNGETAVKD